MVHCNIGATHSNATNAGEDCDTKSGYGNCDEARGLISWRNRGGDKSNSIAIGESDDSIVGYQ